MFRIRRGMRHRQTELEVINLTVPVEPILGEQATMCQHGMRNIGLRRTEVKIAMTNLMNYMKRLGQLVRRDALAAISREVTPLSPEGRPEQHRRGEIP